MTQSATPVTLLGIVARSARTLGGQVTGLFAVVAQLGRGAFGCSICRMGRYVSETTNG